MSRGKYSPNLPCGKEFIYNCYGKPVTEWDWQTSEGDTYDELTMFANYDDEGYDSYGYSAFDEFGNYMGIGGGVDRNGYTEHEYLCMTDDEWEDVQWNLTTIPKPAKILVLTHKQEIEMAKETKAQREARMETETAQRVAVAKATYTERMMALLERAVKENFELTVENQCFTVRNRDARGFDSYAVTPAWNDMADCELYELEMAVESKEEEREERERLAKAKATALAKLTKEEKELLGL